MDITLDIETIPTQREDIKAKIAESITPPGNLKKADTIEKWNEEERPKAIDAEWRKTALNGTYGEIIGIGWKVNDEPAEGAIRKLEQPESDVLEKFYQQLLPRIAVPGRPQRPLWIGHYISEFDLRFIWQRSVINQIVPAFRVPYDAKPWSEEIFDTKIQWTGLRSTGYGTLDDICLAMGYAGKGEMDGSKVWDAILEGRYTDVLNYMLDDVEDARGIYKRMTFRVSA